MPSSQGNEQSVDDLTPALYRELRRLSAHLLQRRTPQARVSATSLVHHAYVKLAAGGGKYADDRHFFSVAAKAMRSILVDLARRRSAQKRGADHGEAPLWESIVLDTEPDLDLVALDAALERLSALDHRKSRIVELRFFAGLSVDETADVLESSPATVKREWALARAWLRREIS